MFFLYYIFGGVWKYLTRFHRLGTRSVKVVLLAVAVGVYLIPSPIDPEPYMWVSVQILQWTDLQRDFRDVLSHRCMFSRFEGPPPALDGPLAVNTRLQRGRRLFSGQLKGPESFTADQNGEPGLVLYLFDLRNAVRFHLFTVSLKETSTRAPSMGSCGESATAPSLSSLRWAETSLNVVNRFCNSASLCKALHVAGWICIGCHGGVCWKNPTARVSRCHHTLDMLKWFTKTQVLFYQSLGWSKESWMQMSSLEHNLWFLLGSRSLCYGLYPFDASLLFDTIIMLVKEFFSESHTEC